MRFFLWFAGCFALIWCIWWGIASVVLRSGVEAWLAQQRAEGWQAEAQIKGGGFPAHLVANLQDLALADPGTGVALSATEIRIEADAWWPGQARLHLPQDGINLAAPDGRVDLVMADGLMRMNLTPSSNLTLRELSWTSGPWGLSDVSGSVVSAQSLNMAMQQLDMPTVYGFDINAETLAPGTNMRERLRIPSDWPVSFETFRARMTVTFDQPWDIRAIEERRPQPRLVDLELAEVAWGDLRLNLAANLEVEDGGKATGDIRIQARNWQTMLDLAETAGALPSRFRPQAERVLASLAGASGNPNAIDVSLTARGGFLFLGFVPLGPAPRIMLR